MCQYVWPRVRKHRCRMYTSFLKLLSQMVSVSSKQCIESFSPLHCQDIQRPPGKSVHKIMLCFMSGSFLYPS
jgi:hypothetical protein